MTEPLLVQTRPVGVSWKARVAAFFINRDYALFIAGSFVSALGSWLQTVALGWLVLELGNSAFLLGMANFMQMVPLLFLGLLGGAVADRVDRRRLLLTTQSISMLVYILLAALTWAHLITIPMIMGLSLITGVLNSFQWPTWQVFIKDLVGPDKIRPAIAVNAARFNLTRVLGPALAGVLLAQIGIAGTLAVGAVAMVGVLVSCLAIRVPRSAPRGPAQPWIPVLKEGVTFAWREPRVREILLVTAAVGFLAMPYQTFLPAFARDVMQIGEQGLGFLLSAVGVGAVVGALGSGTRRVGRRPYLVMGGLVLGTGLSLAVFAASGSLWLALPALAIVGLASIGYMATANATVQLAVPDALMGRIMGLWVVVNAGIMPLGSLALGAVADQVGVQVSVGAAGLVCALAGLGVGWRHRSSRQ